MDSIDSFASVMGALTAAFPNNKVSVDTVRVYQATLEDIPPDLLKQAALKCIATKTFFPTVAELRQAAAELRQPTVQLSGGEAWGQFIRLSANYANDAPLPSDAPIDPILRKTINALGWCYLCASTDGMADRAHFMKTYDAIARRETVDAQLPPGLRAANAALEQMGNLARLLESRR